MQNSKFIYLLKKIIDKDTLGFKNFLYVNIEENDRAIFLAKFSDFCSDKFKNIAILPSHFKILASEDRYLFELYLFNFLIPLYSSMVKKNKWDDVLNLETAIYNEFIKQDETEVFYQLAFAELYSCYSKIKSQESSLKKIDNQGTPTLYLLMNFNKLAHVEVLLDYFANLNECSNIYVSALNNNGLDVLKNDLEFNSIKYFTLSQDKSITERYSELIKKCMLLGIANIVFVSLPLHSNYLNIIAPDNIKLTWWSMKFPLGGMKQFSRLVCCRSMVPDTRIFNNSSWACAPFALNGIDNKVSENIEQTTSDVIYKFGVLAREEKFASSKLPEAISNALLTSVNSHFYWTGRTYNESIQSRLNGATNNINNRIHFSGWVNPVEYLNEIDILIDTPNLGGVVTYWAMSMNKIVISCTESGSIGALGSENTLSKYFLYLSTIKDVKDYFSSTQQLPFYLSDISLISSCIEEISSGKININDYGILFGKFFQKHLTNFNKSSSCIESMIRGEIFHA